MSSTLIRHPSLPAFVRTFNADFDASKELQGTFAEDLAAFSALTERIYLINDIRKLRFGVDDMIAAVAMGRSQVANLTHPMIIEVLFVVGDRFMELAIKGLKSPVMGSLNVRPVKSVEEAEEYIREQVGVQG